VTILIGLAIACVTILVVTGHNTSELDNLITNILAGLSVLGGGGAFLYASASAKSAHNVEEQTNGTLDTKISSAIKSALLEHDAEVHGVNPTVPPPLNAPEVKSGT
jgi:hypothetical protein